MEQKDFDDLKTAIICDLGARMETKFKDNFGWIKTMIIALSTLFLAFVGIGVTNMINVSNVRYDTEKNAEELKNISADIKSIRIEVTIPVQLALTKVNMLQSLINKDMNAYNKYNDIATKLELELYSLKYPQEQIRGK